jgi:hypothetical protein
LKKKIHQKKSPSHRHIKKPTRRRNTVSKAFSAKITALILTTVRSSEKKEDKNSNKANRKGI